MPERPGKESSSGSEEGSLDEKYLSQDNSQISTEGGEEEKLAVYIARYSYDPYQHSPNDNPEAELAFQAGEYLYVFGEMDEVRSDQTAFLFGIIMGSCFKVK